MGICAKINKVGYGGGDSIRFAHGRKAHLFGAHGQRDACGFGCGGRNQSPTIQPIAVALRFVPEAIQVLED